MNYLPEISQIYLPYRRNKLEIERLRSFSKNPFEYDVAIIGNSPRREQLTDQLRHRGITVVHITKFWRDQRDMEVGKAKILLNVHASLMNYIIYEHIRCDRWVFAGKAIISEECNNQESLELIGNNVLFAPYDELLQRVEEALASFDDFRSEFTNNNLESIASVRDEHWQRFVDSCTRDLRT